MDGVPENLRGFVRTTDEDYSYQVGLSDGWSHGYPQGLQDGWGRVKPTNLHQYEDGFREGTEFRKRTALERMTEKLRALK